MDQTDKNLVFLFDLDNTLINSEQILINLKEALLITIGKDQTRYFWSDIARIGNPDKGKNINEAITQYFQNDPEKIENLWRILAFRACLFPNVIEVLEKLGALGKVCLFTQGNVEWQKVKVKYSGIKNSFIAQYIYEDKLAHLEKIASTYKNHRLYFFDDKPKYLQKIKATLPQTTTVWVKQGKHAENITKVTDIDYAVDRIGDLLTLETILS